MGDKNRESVGSEPFWDFPVQCKWGLNAVKQTLNTQFGQTCMFPLQDLIKLTQTKKPFSKVISEAARDEITVEQSSPARPFSPQPKQILVHTRSPRVVPSVFHVTYNWPSSSPEDCATSTGAVWGSEGDGCVDQIQICSNGWQCWGHLSDIGSFRQCRFSLAQWHVFRS